jgi:hypothetical protein
MKMQSTINLIVLLLFVVIAIGLMASNRGKPSRVGDALQELARQTQGTLVSEFAGFGKVVRFQTDGWPFSFKVSYGLDNAAMSVASYQSLNAYGEYRLLQAFELELQPKAARDLTWTLPVSRAPEVVTGVPEIDNAYVVRTSDVTLAAALLGDPEVQALMSAVCQPGSSIYVGPLTEGLLKRPKAGMGGVAYNEGEEPVSVERLLAIRDMIAAFLDGLAEQHVAQRP